MKTVVILMNYIRLLNARVNDLRSKYDEDRVKIEEYNAFGFKQSRAVYSDTDAVVELLDFISMLEDDMKALESEYTKSQ